MAWGVVRAGAGPRVGPLAGRDTGKRVVHSAADTGSSLFVHRKRLADRKVSGLKDRVGDLTELRGRLPILRHLHDELLAWYSHRRRDCGQVYVQFSNPSE
jgi:hypothetical protein